jgi:predicted DNA binding CopG/RHH family protein
MTIKENQQILAQAIENYVNDEHTKNQLMSTIQNLEFEKNFKSIELFNNVLKELKFSLDELSRKELKQRILLVRSFDY